MSELPLWLIELLESIDPEWMYKNKETCVLIGAQAVVREMEKDGYYDSWDDAFEISPEEWQRIKAELGMEGK